MGLGITSAQATPGILRLGCSSRKTMNHCCLCHLIPNDLDRSAFHGKMCFSHNQLTRRREAAFVLQTRREGGVPPYALDIDARERQ
jgi:hypothetical protein